MAATLDLNQPHKVTLSVNLGEVTLVTIPGGTASLYANSDEPFFFEGSEAAGGDAGTPGLQFRVDAGGKLLNTIEVAFATEYRLVGTVAAQEVWLLARGPSNEEAANAVTEALVDEYLDLILRWLPPEYESMSEVLAGSSRTMARIRGVAELLRRLTTVELGTGIWLTMHARGLGIGRATGERDAELRKRIRQVDDALTKPAILAAVNEALAGVTDETATLTQWFEGPSLALDGTPSDPVLAGGGLPFHLDNTDQALIAGGPGTFFVTAPRLSGSFTEAIYSTIVAIVESKKAAGKSWALVLPPT